MSQGFIITRDEALQCMADYYPAKYAIVHEKFTEDWRAQITIMMNAQELVYQSHPHTVADGARKAALRMYSDARTIARKAGGKPPIQLSEIEEMDSAARADAEAKLEAGHMLHVIGTETGDSVRIVLDTTISARVLFPGADL